MPLALLYLAYIHDIPSNLGEAHECLEQRLLIGLQNDGISEAQTLRCCRDLWRFQQRNSGFGIESLSSNRYSQVYHHLEAFTQGDWKVVSSDGEASIS